MVTLRAWERRYDFPKSKRTAGGHRLYSEKDVLQLRWVKERIDEGSLLLLGALLRRRRWPVSYLGQALPLSDLAEFVEDLNPSMKVLIAMTESTAAELIEWPNWLPGAAQKGKPIVRYGGRIFTHQPEYRLSMAGTYLGDTFRAGLANIERLLFQSG